MKPLFFSLIAITLFWHCTQTPPRTRKADCYVRYLKPEGQLQAEITLRETATDRDSTYALEVAGGVRYRGTLMRALTLNGTPTYRIEQTGGYPLDHTFAWQHDGQAYETALSLSPITAFSFNADPISLKKPATLTWDGAPLESNEGIAMIWENPAERLTVPMEIIGTPGQDRIEFPAAQLAKLAPGTWTLYLVRKKTFRSEANGLTVHGMAEYYSDVDTVRIQAF